MSKTQENEQFSKSSNREKTPDGPNRVASYPAGVVTNDMVPSEKPIAADRAMDSFTSFGRIKQDGTVNLDWSRFDRKR